MLNRQPRVMQQLVCQVEYSFFNRSPSAPAPSVPVRAQLLRSNADPLAANGFGANCPVRHRKLQKKFF